jgi:small subunit ribosomal protein S16
LATVIRLTRHGKAHHPIYRVVVADSRKPRDGKFLEEVGFYDPNKETPEVRFEAQPVVSWLMKGAQPSDTVRSLLKTSGVWEMFQAAKKGDDVSNFELKPRAFKAKKKKLGPKAKARLEAENAPAEEAAEA